MSPGWLEAVNLGAKQMTRRNWRRASWEYHDAQFSRQKPSSQQPPGGMLQQLSPHSQVLFRPKELLRLRSQPLARGNPHSKIGEHKSSLFSTHENSEGPLQAQSSLKIRWTSVESVSHLSFSPCLILFPRWLPGSLENALGNFLPTDSCFSVCFSKDQTFDRRTILFQMSWAWYDYKISR